MPKANVRWKRNKIVEIAVKDDVSGIAQMLDEPYLLFYRLFFHQNQPPTARLDARDQLFCCGVTRQFLQQSLVGNLNIETDQSPSVPRLKVMGYIGNRMVSVWKDTPDERTFVLLGERSGGQLIDFDPLATGDAAAPTVLKNLAPTDFDEIREIELRVLWTFPLLNERLHLIHTLGLPVDPLKELLFERPLRSEYKTFIDILACHGGLKDWGYTAR